MPNRIETSTGATGTTSGNEGIIQVQQENLALKDQILHLQQENQDLKEQLEKADELAIEDFLTGLYNRRGLERSVEEVSEGIKREMENKKILKELENGYSVSKMSNKIYL